MGVSPPLFAELASYTNTFESLVAMAHNGATLTLDRGGTEIKLTGITTSRASSTFWECSLVRSHVFSRRRKAGQRCDAGGKLRLWQRHLARSAPGRRTITSAGALHHRWNHAADFPVSAGSEGNNFGCAPLRRRRIRTAMREARHWDVVGRLRTGSPWSRPRLAGNCREKESTGPSGSEPKWTIEAKPARTLFVGRRWSGRSGACKPRADAAADLLCERGNAPGVAGGARRTEFSVRMAIGAGRSGWFDNSSREPGARRGWCSAGWFWEWSLRAYSPTTWRVCCIKSNPATFGLRGVLLTLGASLVSPATSPPASNAG